MKVTKKLISEKTEKYKFQSVHWRFNKYMVRIGEKVFETDEYGGVWSSNLYGELFNWEEHGYRVNNKKQFVDAVWSIINGK